MRIRILGVPPGDAPEDIRRAWVGLVLPLAPGFSSGPISTECISVLSGPWARSFVGGLWRRMTSQPELVEVYIVRCDQAFEVLATSAPAAMTWWQEYTPHLIGSDESLAFSSHVCEIIPDL